MFGLFFYALVCFIAAAVLVGLLNLVMKVAKTGEGSAAPRLFITWLLLMGGPYAWVEWQTRSHGSEFKQIVQEVADRNLISGDLAYFKVQRDSSKSAKLLLVSGGENNWGGTFRNIYSLKLHQAADGWSLDSIDPINTADGDSAGFSFPPYW